MSRAEHAVPAQIEAHERYRRFHEVEAKSTVLPMVVLGEAPEAAPERVPVDPKVFPSRYIQRLVGDYYGVKVADILGHGRPADLVRFRYVAMYLARKFVPRSSTILARQFGDRHHTTILRAVGVIAAGMEIDADLAADVAHLTAELVKVGMVPL